MALQIKNNYGIIEISGSIVGENTRSLKQHCEQLLSKSDQIILSVDHVSKIDASGVQVLTTLYRNAMKLNKIFCVIGKENKNIRNAFGKVNYILRSDFV
ncbi:STAS domain-containing protein [uncultured Aquimarina sp.]|uniref:STAS domain-containing protein n=1 Tax=uncultured Aquimarina sp. TaxID=575652 RepID=UPI002639FEF8|nr:STAS domain-containing protein [uncultured Aquimarina sp.]